ncbi:MAG: hypothetical protein AAFY82_04925 [Pseudomonadota bacterium]
MIRMAFLAASVSALALPVSAEETGSFAATCTVQGTAAQMQMTYTRYRDVAVWQDRHGLNSQATDMGGWGPTYWEGMINTAFGQYRLTGENQFVEAWLVGGVYSDMITLELSRTGETTFSMRDFYNDGPWMPCQVTGQ